jgi:hypothetical protein
MIGRWVSWGAFGVVIVAAVMFGAVANTVAVSPPVTSYTVTFKEVGLATGTSWSVTFNGVTNTGTGTSIKFTGMSAGSYSYYYEDPVAGKTTSIRYVPWTYANTIAVPSVLTVTNVYQAQYYTTVGVTPVSSGGVNPGTNWYAAGSNLSISASASNGYAFQKWTVTPASSFVLASTTLESTEVVINGVGTITAHFTSTKYKISFLEVGLPVSTSWTVTFAGTSTVGSTSTISAGSHGAGSYAWNIPDVSVGSTAQYAPTPSGSNTMYVPQQQTQEIVFVKQYLVTLADSPSGAGSTSPSGAAYYTNGTSFPVIANPASGWVFSKWTVNQTKIGVGNVKDGGTNATVKNTGVLTADFVTGTPCTTCSLTFSEIGLPHGTTWGVTFGSATYGTSTASLTITGITASSSWGAFQYVGTGQYGVTYNPVAPNSGSWTLGSTSAITVVYEKFDYVTFQLSPYYAGGSATLGSGWYADASVNPLSAVSSAAWHFSSWTSTGPNVTFGAASASSTPMTVKGPGTVTMNFVQPTATVHFLEYGLPTGAYWGVAYNGVNYYSTGQYINVTGAAYGNLGWSAESNIYGGVGIEWDAVSYYGAVNVPFQTYASVIYQKAVYVTFVAGGTSGGTVDPSGSTWYLVGDALPILAENGTSVTFTAWSQTAGTATISSAGSASTVATIKATGTITASFA